MVQCCNVAMVQYCNLAILHSCNVAKLHICNIACPACLSSRSAMLQSCNLATYVAILNSCKVAMLHICNVAHLQSCTFTKFQSCNMLQGCKVAKLQWYNVTMLHCYNVAKLQCCFVALFQYCESGGPIGLNLYRGVKNTRTIKTSITTIVFMLHSCNWAPEPWKPIWDLITQYSAFLDSIFDSTVMPYTLIFLSNLLIFSWNFFFVHFVAIYYRGNAHILSKKNQHSLKTIWKYDFFQKTWILYRFCIGHYIWFFFEKIPA